MAEVKIPSPVKNNSDQARREKENATDQTPVTTGKLRKRNLAMKFADVFFEGSLNDAVDYLIHDVAIPQIKDAFLRGIEVMFYGGARGSSRTSGDQKSYSSYFIRSDGTRSSVQRPTPRPQQNAKNVSPEEITKIKRVYDPKLIEIEDRGKAERVLEELKADLNEYGQVSVQRLFSLVDIESDWASTSYGWVRGDLDRARVVGCRGGWRFDLPDPYPID